MLHRYWMAVVRERPTRWFLNHLAGGKWECCRAFPRGGNGDKCNCGGDDVNSAKGMKLALVFPIICRDMLLPGVTPPEGLEVMFSQLQGWLAHDGNHETSRINPTH